MTTRHAKVLVIVPYPFDEPGLDKRRAQLDEVHVDSSIEFVYKPVRITPGTFASLPDYLLADIAVYEAGVDAEDDGYDAVCVDTVSDSGVEALRASLGIPVIGPGRASLLTALMFGEKFSIVTYGNSHAGRLAQYGVDLYRKLLKESGLTDRCASIRLADIEPDDENLFEGREEEVFPLVLEACLACIDDGADVICLGSTTMHQAHAYCAERLPIPVINPGPLTYKLAEAALAMGLSQSRTAYLPPKLRPSELVHAMLEAGGRSQVPTGE